MTAFAVLIALSATAPVEIPPAFHGRWGLDMVDCAAPAPGAPAPDGLIVVRGDGIEFFASRADLLDVVTPDRGFAFVALVHNEGEEHPIRERIVLRLDGATLVVRLGGDALSYRRCPEVARRDL